MPAGSASRRRTGILAFAAAATIEADIYLFDEILAVGDVGFQQLCREHFSQMKTQGKTVVLVHHSLSELNKFCDRIICLDQGQIISDQSTRSPSIMQPHADAVSSVVPA